MFIGVVAEGEREEPCFVEVELAGGMSESKKTKWGKCRSSRRTTVLKVQGVVTRDAEYVPVLVCVDVPARVTAEADGKWKRAHERGNAFRFGRSSTCRKNDGINRS